jgi:hypothetical protein
VLQRIPADARVGRAVVPAVALVRPVGIMLGASPWRGGNPSWRGAATQGGLGLAQSGADVRGEWHLQRRRVGVSFGLQGLLRLSRRGEERPAPRPPFVPHYRLCELTPLPSTAAATSPLPSACSYS